jgi:D-sedoheptulose 7-phosphate isomerase
MTADTITRSHDVNVEEVTAAYLRELAEQVHKVDSAALSQIAVRVVDTLAAGATVFVAGNGGSASTSGHFVCDVLNTCRLVGMAHARIVGLADNVATITALANDEGFEDVFAAQLQMQARPNDLLLILSVSGNSENLLRASVRAREMDLGVVAALGNAGRVLAHCDHWIETGAGDYGLAEDLHMSLAHIVIRVLNGGRPRVLPDGSRSSIAARPSEEEVCVAASAVLSPAAVDGPADTGAARDGPAYDSASVAGLAT